MEISHVSYDLVQSMLSSVFDADEHAVSVQLYQSVKDTKLQNKTIIYDKY